MDSVITNELVLKSPIIMFPPDSLSTPVFILFILTFCSGIIVGYLLALYFQATIWQQSNRLGNQTPSKQSTTDNNSRLHNHGNDLDKISTAFEDFIKQVQASSSSDKKHGTILENLTTGNQEPQTQNDLNLTIGELFQTFSTTLNKKLSNGLGKSSEKKNTGTYTKHLRDSLFKNLGDNGTHHISFTEDSESENESESESDSDVDDVINLVNGDLIDEELVDEELVNEVDHVEENPEDNE